jgi:tRNA U34 5-carboxymethylaminomethyl modifying GTPase MnmE/TrmE
MTEWLNKQFENEEISAYSAINGDGLSEIKNIIRLVYEEKGSQGSDSVIITNSRHRDAAEALYAD